jgi:hypothetical protein
MTLLSCTTDAYEKGDGEHSYLQAEMADMHTNLEKRVDYIITDAGEKLKVSNPFAARWLSTPDSVYRAVVYFSKTDDGAEVTGVSRVGVLVPKKFDDFTDDPVRFESSWVGKSGRYLNASIYLMLGSTSDEDAIHRIGCQKDTLIVHADSTSTLFLRLYHDQGGVPEYYSQRTYVSIPLDSVRADSVCLSINTYEGTVAKTLAVRNP